VRGSQSQSGTNSNRIVVFEDPVSSLDGEVLFIVSNLIKDLIGEVRAKERSNLKQIFCMTHNIYFHKEVSFDPDRGREPHKFESFWIIRKKAGASRFVRYQENPIKTAYEMLWKEIRDPEEEASITIHNTMRRILENYFQILGNWKKDDIVNMFEGVDKQVCNSLFSWINDGSHWAQDDLYVSCDVETIERYHRVFREVFIKTNNEGHYNMMMNNRGNATELNTTRCHSAK
jgi:wobble nucleotide-excising tRNase